jgi:predicted ATPase/class 3 adenylate cyclase
VGLPTGAAVTFLFTDIEGSTRLERAVGSGRWADLVARHDALLAGTISAHGGSVVKTEGDAFFAAFASPTDAALAAAAVQRALAGEPWPVDAPIRVRMGLHLGEGRLRQGRAAGEPDDYVGIDVNYAARISAAANGGQVVVSATLADALAPAFAAVEHPDGLADVSLVDEGLRAVKDFEEPLRLHRLVIPGAAEDPRRLRTLDPPTNLPGEVTPLVGREAELESLGATLAEQRIVTLTGPGGSGKTRLALAAARSVADRFPHGTWFVDLAAVRDAALLESAVASALGVGESRELTVAEALAAHLRPRTLLIVLDNLEQLLPDAAGVVGRLVRGAPELRVIATSRERLRIAGEHAYPVPPLGTDAGVALFEERARAHRPDLVISAETAAAIRTICERLAGLPLAIELAAARSRLLPPTVILERLGRSLDLATGSRDAPERQRTLRAAISWSHELLAAPERVLFRRLAVFAGGWTLETVGDVAGAEADLGLDLLDGLESLVDKSLVRLQEGPAGGAVDGATPGAWPVAGDGEVRFGLHPLLREYALERLDESGERASVEERHALVVVAMCETVGAELMRPGGDAALRRLDQEDRNVRAAIDWSRSTGGADVGLRILAAVWRWYQQRGRLREARAALAELLALPWDEGSLRTRIGGLNAEGGLAYWMDDAAAARIAYEERLRLATETADPVLMADAHYDLGFLFMVAGEAEGLLTHERQALDLYRQAGDDEGLTRARQALVLGVFLAGDYAAARELEEENLAVFRRAASPLEVADSLTFLSAVHYKLGDPTTGWQRLTEGLRLFAANEATTGVARSLGMAAIMRLGLDDPVGGARIAGAAYRLIEDKGLMLAPVKVLHLPEPRTLAIERLGAERAAELMADGAATPIERIVETILDLPAPTATTT